MDTRNSFTANGLATLLGVSRQAVRKRADREGWKSHQREGRGGGNDWLLASMPKATRDQVLAAVLSQEPAEEPNLPVPSQSTAPAIPAESSLVIAQLTERQRRTMEARLVFVREVERLTAAAGKETAVRGLVEAARGHRLAKHLQALVNVANDRPGKGEERGLSRRRLYGWCAVYAIAGAAALAPQHKQRDMSVPPWANEFLALYQTPQHPSVADCLRRLEWPGQKPTIHAVYRFLKKIGVPALMTGRATGNALTKLRPHKLRTTESLLPGDVYTADGTTFDAEIQNPLNGQPFKPEITLVIDVATRKCVGVSVGLGESGLTILDALRMACCYGGLPLMLYTDNGSGYKNKLLLGEGQGMLARLDIQMVNSIPTRPQGKGLMERAVQTICTPLSKRLPSCTHKDMDRDAALKVFRLSRKDIKEKGRSDLLPTWPEFLKQLLARVEEYNATPHSSLPLTVTAEGKRRRMSPDEYWQDFEARGWQPFSVPAQEREDLFMPGCRRTVRNGVVRLFNGEYFASDLEEFHGSIVEVRYDIWDSSRVHVWTTKGEKVCTAELNAHALPYFPPSQVEALREKRKAGQVLRLAKKLEAIEPGARIEVPEPVTHEPLFVADSIQPEAEAEVAEVMERTRAEQKAAPVEARPNFQFPYEKYEWLMRNRGQWTDTDVAWLNRYTQGEDYADLHDHYKSMGIAWSGDILARAGEF
ncbi:putative transposase [Humidesulfovibrio mexicanus]|uniref:Putative transposase n=1 Tax=Humidesulfovibrio mexicanus TaxID=147047 RepID=A0A238XK47_9BACT|nr:Mu transposase C-terminal domain-containing protein [Humidesulfovibrio mexicanus]SNR59376.1 putative transposase [Humidesulfovibrio mexicanus]